MSVTAYKLKGETEYYRDLKALIAAYGRHRTDGRVGLHEFARAMGEMSKLWSGKVTLSLNRALLQAELDGLVVPVFVLSERGGRMKMFEIKLEKPRQMELAEAAADFPF
jgi:hypothetical protein